MELSGLDIQLMVGSFIGLLGVLGGHFATYKKNKLEFSHKEKIYFVDTLMADNTNHLTNIFKRLDTLEAERTKLLANIEDKNKIIINLSTRISELSVTIEDCNQKTKKSAELVNNLLELLATNFLDKLSIEDFEKKELKNLIKAMELNIDSTTQDNLLDGLIESLKKPSLNRKKVKLIKKDT